MFIPMNPARTPVGNSSTVTIVRTFIASFVAVYALETAALAVIGWAR
jgi:hypothetical protein